MLFQSSKSLKRKKVPSRPQCIRRVNVLLNRKYIYIFLKSCLRLSVVALGGKITDTKMTSLTHANMHGEASLSQVISKSALVCGLKAWLCVFKEIKIF